MSLTQRIMSIILGAAVLTLWMPLRAEASAQASSLITAYLTSPLDLTTLDPQRVEDSIGVMAVENLLLGLTDYDPRTQELRPEAATRWTRTDPVWTFQLRGDLAWVNYNPQTGKTTTIGTVTAKDFEYGIKLACDPRNRSYYVKVAASLIKGCDAVSTIRPDQFKPADLDRVEVRAANDFTLQVTLQNGIAYFDAVAALPMLRAVHRPTVEKFGADWILPGNIVTNGPFVLETWSKGVGQSYLRNPYYPRAFQNTYGGNIERVVVATVPESAALALYEAGQVDSASLPRSDQGRIFANQQLSRQIARRYEMATYYFGFAYDKPPFDKVQVRRAFAAILDRRAFVNDSYSGRGVPITHLTPPGAFGAASINEIGPGEPKNGGYDPQYARRELEAAGFAGCKNFPPITILVENDDGVFAEHLQKQAQLQLGCDSSTITILRTDYAIKEQLIRADAPIKQRPHLWFNVWIPDYLDAASGMTDLIGCRGANPFKRQCSTLDQRIEQAGREGELKRRAALYRDLEVALFGSEGEMPLAPFFTGANLTLVKPYFTGPFDTDGLLWGMHWDAYRIDSVAQAAGRRR